MNVQPDPAALSAHAPPLDREALLRRFPAERGRLVASLARLVGSAEAEDLAQETLLRALSAVNGFRGDAALGTWLHRIGVNLAYDLLRRQSAIPMLSADTVAEISEAATDTAGGDLLEQRQTIRCVRNMLAKLPAQQRDAIVQADMFDRSVTEFARDAGITAGNAKIRLHRARRALKAALERNCSVYYGAAGDMWCTPKVAR